MTGLAVRLPVFVRPSPVTMPEPARWGTAVWVPLLGVSVLAWQAKWPGHCAAGDLICAGEWITRLGSLAREQGGVTYHARCANQLPAPPDEPCEWHAFMPEDCDCG